MSNTPETDKIVKDSKHIKFLEDDYWSLNGKVAYTSPIVCLCRKLERERDRLADQIEANHKGTLMLERMVYQSREQRDLWKAEAERWREQAGENFQVTAWKQLIEQEKNRMRGL